ncbi:MAG: YfhO family protein [Lachnospiraceae bacterium]|nr:YfhO family protein [Lachnospiraceae bacterium]
MGVSKGEKYKNLGVIRCAVIGLITASIAMGYFIVRNKGVFTIIGDFDEQQLTFPSAVWSTIHDGRGGQWCWNLDLGASIINGFSFYNLGSPFNWIFLLFPKGSAPYISGYLYIIKYVAACITAYIYLNGFRSAKDGKDYAVIGALLYAFSGFQTVNLLFFHFHDVVAFFPLLLWGIENIEYKEKRYLFILSIFINCLVNYFFFIQEVVFMAIYFVVRYWGEPIKKVGQKMVACIFCGIVGVGMASVLFIPSIIYITGNSRSEIALYLSNFVNDSKNLLYLIKGILIPGEPMRGNSALILTNWCSTSCYLPFVGLSFVITFLKRDRSWLQRLIILMFLITLFPFLQSGFLMFTTVYQRWWYMFVLIMSLATVKVMENAEDYQISAGIWIYVLITTTFYLCIKHISWNSGKEQIVFHNDRFAYFYVIAVFGPVLMDMLMKMGKLKYSIVLVLTMFSCILTTALTLHYYKYDSEAKVYIDKYEATLKLKKINDQYRYLSVDNVETLNGDAAGIGVFSSTIENSSRDFSMLFDITSQTRSLERKDLPGLGQLLGGKYSITSDANAKNIVDTVKGKDTELYVTEGEACPIGYAVSDYVYLNELVRLPKNQRGIALMNGVAIKPSDEPKIEGTLNHLKLSSVSFDAPTDTLIKKAKNNAVKDFKRDSKGFRCRTDYKKDSIVFFTVPNDKGWVAKIDGEPTDIIDSGGLMLIKVPKGEHMIDFEYHTVGFKEGIIISVICWIVCLSLMVYRYNSCLSKKKAGKS